jgi:hypothetical protein
MIEQTTMTIIREAPAFWDMFWMHKYPEQCPWGVMCIWEYMIRQRQKHGTQPRQRITVVELTPQQSWPKRSTGYPLIDRRVMALQHRKNAPAHTLINSNHVVSVRMSNHRYGGLLYLNDNPVLTPTARYILTNDELRRRDLPPIHELHEICEKYKQWQAQDLQCKRHARARQRQLRRINITDGKT